MQYGNGGKVKYAYDGYDRLTGVRYDSETSDRYAYEYGADGQASVVRDNNLGRVAQTACDLSGRATESQLRDASGNVLYRAGMTYDARNRLTGLNETANGQAHATTYAYDNDNRVTGMTFDGGNALSYTYDSLGRIASRTASPLSTTYGYAAGGYGTGSTTPLVASIQQTAISFSYTYDSRGNIVSETRSGQTTTYEYDALGQLTRVNDPHENATWVYAYDRGGNMTSKVKYAYTTGTLGGGQTTAFTYDSAWKDRLTANGQYPLTYDAIGNLKSYGGWTFEWEAGRQLKRQTQNATVVTYDYDHNGMRVRKTVANTSGYVYTTYNYTWHGDQLAHMTKGTDELHFFYDAQGRPARVSYNGVIYTYVHNLQGDIVGILDGNGTVVVEYKYNAWGTQLSRTGELANTLGYANPFRYRGYIYDDETWMYWLRSRYYYPELHRFINADCTGGVVGCLISHSAFTYCSNAPVDQADYSGKAGRIVSKALNTITEIAMRKVINAICGYEQATKIGNFSVKSVTRNNTITKKEADAHNSVVSEVVEDIAIIHGVILGAYLSDAPKFFKMIGKAAGTAFGGWALGKVSGRIQDIFVDAFTVRPGTYTSIQCQYERNFKVLFFVPAVEVHSYELRIYPDYCEVWYSHLYSDYDSTITPRQKLGEMTLVELEEALGGW
mgnify:CR=1 FL=1